MFVVRLIVRQISCNLTTFSFGINSIHRNEDVNSFAFSVGYSWRFQVATALHLNICKQIILFCLMCSHLSGIKGMEFDNYLLIKRLHRMSPKLDIDLYYQSFCLFYAFLPQVNCHPQ